jgi:hypothetical protein
MHASSDGTCNLLPGIAMKETILYWLRVLILAGILLFILISCTAWAQPDSGISSCAISSQVKNSTSPENLHMPQQVCIE